MTNNEKVLLAYDLMIESVHQPDNELRSSAKEQDCFIYLMKVREDMLDYLKSCRAMVSDLNTKHKIKI